MLNEMCLCSTCDKTRDCAFFVNGNIKTAKVSAERAPMFSINEIEAVLIEIAKDISGDCGLTEPDVDYIIDELGKKKTC